MFGNLNFIAHLTRNKMINLKIAQYILDRLLEQESSDKSANTLNTYEGACKFLSAIGSEIDKACSGKELTKKQQARQDDFEQFLVNLQALGDSGQVDNRIRMIVKNTLDTRKDNWQSKLMVVGAKSKKDLR